MQYLAERTAEQPFSKVDSHAEIHRSYHEEDLLVDIWLYKDQSHLLNSLHLLVEPVKQAGFYSNKPHRAHGGSMSFP